MYPTGFHANYQSPAPLVQPSYTWVPASSGTVPPGAVVGGKDGSHNIFVGRAHHNDELLPGKVFPKHRVCYVAHGGKEHAKNDYQVLCGSNVKWVHTSGSNVPPGAIVGGGCHEGGESLYIGRANHCGNYVVGKVHPRHGYCYIPYGGKEHRYRDYEVLVSSGNELTRNVYPQAMMAPNSPMQYQSMYQQMSSPNHTQPCAASNVPMYQQAPMASNVPMYQQAPMTSNVPMYQQAPMTSNVPMYQQAPMTFNVPRYQQAPMTSNADYTSVSWENSINGNIPAGAFLGGRETNNDLYVARAYHENDLLPGKGHPVHRVCYVAWGGKEHSKKDFQVLCGRNFTWVSNSGSYKPSNAIPGGNTSDGETLYIGRVKHRGSHAIGKVHLSHRGCYIPYDGREHKYNDYEILVSCM